MTGLILFAAQLILLFLIGFTAGLIVRRAANLVVLVIALFVLLTACGAVTVYLPKILEEAAARLPEFIGSLRIPDETAPYAALAFALGFIIGVLKKTD